MRHMRRKIFTTLALSALMAGTLVPPASALTKSGSTTCTAGATVAAHGEQQRAGDLLTLKVGGNTLFQSRAYYRYTANSGLGGTRTWSAESASLLLSSSRGVCLPPGA